MTPDPPPIKATNPDGALPLGCCRGQLWRVQNGGFICGSCGTVWTVPPADCSGGRRVAMEEETK